MKKIILSMMIATAFLSSCNKEITIIEENSQEFTPTEETTIRFKLFDPDALHTKGTGTFDETTIKTLLICLFRPDGSLDVIREFSDVNQDTDLFTRCEVGAKRNIYAIANWAPQTPITKESDVQALMSHLSDNDQTKMVMTGVLKDENIIYNGTYPIPISRLALKISLEGIKNGLEPFNLKTKSITIKSLSIINVPIEAPLFSEAWSAKNEGQPFTPSEWWNKGKWGNDAEVNSYTHDEINVTLKPGETYKKTHSFYLYGNPIIDPQERLDIVTWTPRQTRLVAEVQIDSQTYYYSKKLVKIKPNFHYLFHDFIITRKGSDNPDISIDNSYINSQVSVVEWNVIDCEDIVM